MLLRVRLREGLPLDALDRDGGARSPGGPSTTVSPRRRRYDEGRLVLTLRGRLLADALVRDLVD